MLFSVRQTVSMKIINMQSLDMGKNVLNKQYWTFGKG